MKIGIFSKLGSSGGSEHRAAEMANGIVRFSNHQCVLLCEGNLNARIRDKLDKRVEIELNVFADVRNLEAIYKPDIILIINSDSYTFSKIDYWHGESEKHHYYVDLSRLRLVFLYNFVISPSRHLADLERHAADVRIVCANKDFFNAINERDKFKNIRHLPRLILESPIDPESITPDKQSSAKIRIGKHSKAFGYKFNEQHCELIEHINRKHGDKIAWDFLGVPNEHIGSLAGFPNVTIRREYSIPVGEYLKGIDVFLFFLAWDRNEPWSRAVAEGMMAGCPILANNRAGNRDQVVHENTGYLCDDLDDFEKRLCYLIENPEVIKRLGSNARLNSMQYTLDKVISRFLAFVET